MMSTFQTSRLLPALLSGVGALLLAACASGPDPSRQPAKAGPSACFAPSCCAEPASLQFAPYALYCRFEADRNGAAGADAPATLREAIAAARAEVARKTDADAVLCFALKAAARLPDLSAQDSLAKLEDSLLACQASYGEASDIGAQALHDAATQRLALGQAEQVRPQLERVVELAKRNGNPGLEAHALDGLGRHAGLTGDSEGERRLLLQAVDVKKAVYGEASPEVAASYTWLGRSYIRTGDGALAREWYLRAIGIMIDKLGAAKPQTMEVMAEFADSHADDGNFKQAQIMFDMLLPKVIQTYGARDERTVTIVDKLGATLERQKRYAKALALFERALKVRRMTMPDSVGHGTTALNAAKAKRALAGCAGAKVHAREALRVARAVQAAPAPDPRASAFLAEADSFAGACRMRAAAPASSKPAAKPRAESASR